jgi:hypothetical protein
VRRRNALAVIAADNRLAALREQDERGDLKLHVVVDKADVRAVFGEALVDHVLAVLGDAAAFLHFHDKGLVARFRPQLALRQGANELHQRERAR